MFKYGKASLQTISEVKPLLRQWAFKTLEISAVDISAVDGKRTIEEQAENVANGVSWSMDSRHLPDPIDDLAFALDLYPFVNGKTDHSDHAYQRLAKAGFIVACELGIDIRWGGFWKTPDKPHWHLSRAQYPKSDIITN
jgi:peptidoglycan L-alanyl-D-glutamate endopeptidase CwlK